MSDLIERLSKAERGSRELDVDIARACGIEWSPDEDGNFGGYNILPRRCWFTRSIDAKLPWEDDCYWEICGPYRYLNIPSPVPNHWRAICRKDGKDYVGWGATEELARRIAALKTREGEKGSRE